MPRKHCQGSRKQTLLKIPSPESQPLSRIPQVSPVMIQQSLVKKKQHSTIKKKQNSPFKNKQHYPIKKKQQQQSPVKLSEASTSSYPSAPKKCLSPAFSLVLTYPGTLPEMKNGNNKNARCHNYHCT